MSYVILGNSASNDSIGQSWTNETIIDNLNLCKYQTIKDYFAKYIRPEHKVLEAGCGLGRWVFYLQELGIKNIIGIDSSEMAVSSAKKYKADSPIQIGDVEKTMFENETFDVIISLGVVEHFVDGPQKVLKEFQRILKQNGLLLITIPPENTLRKYVTHPLNSLKRMISGNKTNLKFEEYRYSKKEMENFLTSEGYSIIENTYDELIPPRNIGLYADYSFLQDKKEKWHLNAAGRIVNFVLSTFSPYIHCGGILWICEKK